jgi:hypothetical protein
MRISCRDNLIKTAQFINEKEVNVAFKLNRDGDIVSFYASGGDAGEDASKVVRFLTDRIGKPPYNLKDDSN